LLITASAHGAQFATIAVTEGCLNCSFVVHEELLKYHSPFFRAALDGSFEEAKAKKVRVEASAETVEFFVHWLYNQRLPSKQDHPDLFKLWEYLDQNSYSMAQLNLLRLHVFCDKYDVPVLKRLTLDTYIELVASNSNAPCAAHICIASANMPEDSPICRFVLDVCCKKNTPARWEWLFTPLWEPPVIFYKLALKRYSQLLGQAQSTHSPLDICNYHDHKDEEERNACKAKRAT
jgi:hypothetical protein